MNISSVTLKVGYILSQLLKPL